MSETRKQRKRRTDAEFCGGIFVKHDPSAKKRWQDEAYRINRSVEKRKRAQFRSAAT